MNVKALKIIVGLAVAPVLCFFIPQIAFSQTEKVDIIEYTPPKGWAKTLKEGVTIYSDSNKSTGALCLISVYPSTPSAGDAQKNFANEWREKVVKPFKAETNPKTETQTDGEWTSVSSASQIESDGVKSAVMMTVISGYGRVASVLAILNNQEYLPKIEAFMAGIKMDKAQAMADAKPPPTVNPPAGSSSNSVVGRWGTGTAADTVLGSTITYASNATQKYYQFNADGTFTFVYSGYSGLAGSAGAFHITTQESGVYTLNGDSITITPRKSQTNSNSGGLKNNPLETVTYRWTTHYFEGSGEYVLILHPDHQTKRDGGFDYFPTFPDSYGYSRMK